MKPKHLRTLAAFRLLFQAGDELLDSAAGRLYYAVFQAATAELERQGRRPRDFQSGALRWSHDMVRNNASLIRGRASDRTLIGELFTIRVRGDYAPDAVQLDELPAHRVAQAREFVQNLQP
jgi:uncharacterized protein (UPF0332 family)